MARVLLLSYISSPGATFELESFLNDREMGKKMREMK